MTATAEFFRPRRHLLALQDAVQLRLYEITLEGRANSLDVKNEANARRVGIPYERLISNDLDSATRYQECRELAIAVEARGIGVEYPSAAVRGADWNIVLFGEPGEDRWVVQAIADADVPAVDLGDIEFVP